MNELCHTSGSFWNRKGFFQRSMLYYYIQRGRPHENHVLRGQTPVCIAGCMLQCVTTSIREGWASMRHPTPECMLQCVLQRACCSVRVAVCLKTCAKGPYITPKASCITPKEPEITPKELYITPKEPLLPYPQKSPYIHTSFRSQRAPYHHKRAPLHHKRAFIYPHSILPHLVPIHMSTYSLI